MWEKTEIIHEYSRRHTKNIVNAKHTMLFDNCEHAAHNCPLEDNGNIATTLMRMDVHHRLLEQYF